MARRHHAQIANDYARGVTAGDIVACRYVRLACERHLTDLAASKKKPFPYEFDPAAAAAICRFIELLPHVKGRWARNHELIHLEPWQCFNLGAVFGWKRKADGLRRFRRAYNEIARKNAKSTKSAGLGNYMFAADGEYGAEVYSGATSEKQAWEVFGPARLMTKRSKDFQDACGVHVGAKNLHIAASGSKFEPVIGNPGDGASPHCWIVDEFHEHRRDDQYETALTGMGAREQPLLWVITTAGDDTSGPCYQLRTEVVEMLEGKVQNDELFGIIYTMDDGDDWTSDEALEKANPNIGVSVSREYLQSRRAEAVNYPRKQATFKTKHLNVWVGSGSPYFDTERWDALAEEHLAAAEAVREEFAGEACYVGIDLASKIDLCSIVKIFERMEDGPCGHCRGIGVVQQTDEGVRTLEAVPVAEVAALTNLEECARCEGSGEAVEPHYHVFPRFYLPQVRAKDPANRHYAGWAKSGHLVVTPGNITDYDYIEEDMRSDAEEFALVEAGFDPYNATQLATHLIDAGLNMIEVPQTTKHLSEPMKWTQALIIDGRFHHGGNPILSWCLGNVTAQEDRKGNVFPRKERRENKIDGALALIIAVGRAMAGGAEERSVYEDRGILVA